MPRISKERYQENEKLKGEAYRLYKKGLTLREVEKLVGKSYNWVFRAVREIDDSITKLDKKK